MLDSIPHTLVPALEGFQWRQFCNILPLPTLRVYSSPTGCRILQEITPNLRVCFYILHQLFFILPVGDKQESKKNSSLCIESFVIPLSYLLSRQNQTHLSCAFWNFSFFCCFAQIVSDMNIQIWPHCTRWDLSSTGWSGISSSHTLCLLTPPTQRFTFLKTSTYYWLAQFAVSESPSSGSSVLLSQHLLCNLFLCIWFQCVILPAFLKKIPSHWV